MISLLWLVAGIVPLLTHAISSSDPKLYNVTQLTFSGNHSHPVFSLDNRYIYFVGRGGKYGKSCDEIYRLDLKYFALKQETLKISRFSTGLGHSTRLSVPVDSKKDAYIYESSFEKAFATPDSDVVGNFCPTTECPANSTTTNTDPCNAYFYVEHFDGTTTYTADASGNLIGRKHDLLDNNDFYGSPAQRNSFLVETRKCEKTTSGKQINGTCMYLNGMMPSSLIGFYDFAAMGSTNGNDTRVFFVGREMTSNDYSANVFSTDSTKVYYGGLTMKDNSTTFTLNSSPFVAATANTSYLYPQPLQKASALVLTRIYQNRSISLVEISQAGASAIEITDVRFNSMQASLNEDETSIVFVRQPENQTEYQVYIASLIKSSPKLGPFEALTTQSDNTSLGNLQIESYVKFEGRIGRLRMSNLGGDLFFEFNADNNSRKKCKQIYHVDTVLNDYTTKRLISTGLGDVSGMDFYVPRGKTVKSIIYSSNFMRVVSSAQNIRRCEPVGCDRNLTNYPDLKLLCDSANQTVYLGNDFDLFRANMFGNLERRLTSNNVYDGEPAISSDGRMVFSQTNMDRGSVDLFLRRLDVNGTPMDLLITESILPGYYGGASFSRDNRYLVFHGTQPSIEKVLQFQTILANYQVVDVSVSEIYLIHLKTKNVTQLTFDGYFSQNPTFTPDKKVVFERTDKNGSHSLWQIDMDGKNLHQLTAEDGLNSWKISFGRSEQEGFVFVNDFKNSTSRLYQNQIKFGTYKSRPAKSTTKSTKSTTKLTTKKKLTTTSRKSSDTVETTSQSESMETTMMTSTDKNDPDGVPQFKGGLLPLFLLSVYFFRNLF